MTERASPLPRSAALSQKAALHLPFPFTTPPVKMRLERSAERDKREIKNNLSADYGQSKAEAVLNRLALGAIHHKIRAFGYAVLGKIALFQRDPPGGKIRVAGALPRL